MKALVVLSLACAGFLLFAEAPLGKELKFTDGKRNSAGTGRVMYPVSVVNPEAGTIQFFMKTDQEPATLSWATLCGSGTNAPGWFYLALNKGKMIFFSKREDSFISSIAVDVSEIKKGQWHNLAVSWGTWRGKNFVRLYLDGNLKASGEKFLLPKKFNGKSFGVGYNTANYSALFPGAVDELAVYPVPLTEEQIRENIRLAEKGDAPSSAYGRTLYASFDNTADWIYRVNELEDGVLKRQLKLSSAEKKSKYPDELSFEYLFDNPLKEEIPGCLNDGNESSALRWRQHSLEIIGELKGSADLRLIEIAAPKYTKWFTLQSLHVSVDDGSGVFGSPVIVKTYGIPPKPGDKLTDETCKTYVYRVNDPGRACRVKIRAEGVGYMAISEIRICGKLLK